MVLITVIMTFQPFLLPPLNKTFNAKWKRSILSSLILWIWINVFMPWNWATVTNKTKSNNSCQLPTNQGDIALKETDDAVTDNDGTVA